MTNVYDGSGNPLDFGFLLKSSGLPDPSNSDGAKLVAINPSGKIDMVNKLRLRTWSPSVIH